MSNSNSKLLQSPISPRFQDEVFKQEEYSRTHQWVHVQIDQFLVAQRMQINGICMTSMQVSAGVQPAGPPLFHIPRAWLDTAAIITI